MKNTELSKTTDWEPDPQPNTGKTVVLFMLAIVAIAVIIKVVLHFHCDNCLS